MTSRSLHRHMLKLRKKEGYAAVCVIGFDDDEGVCRIGAAEDVETLLSRLQLGTWHKLKFRRQLWTGGIELANTLCKAAETWLTGAKMDLGHHWYRCELDVVDDLLRAEIIARNATIWTPEQLSKELTASLHREAKKYREGRF